MGKNKRSIIDTKKQGRKSKKVKTDENSEVVPEAVNVVKFSDDNVQRKVGFRLVHFKVFISLSY